MRSFQNEKKTFLAKIDKSKKGEIDPRIISLINLINSKENYYTTSSCSGRVYFWCGTGKKNETNRLKISHSFINTGFFDLPVLNQQEKLQVNGLVWLRLEPFILHVACKDFGSANRLLEKARRFYKKSCLLSASNKVVVEIKGSEYLEMPFYRQNQLLLSGDLAWLADLINNRLISVWAGIDKLTEIVTKLK